MDFKKIPKTNRRKIIGSLLKKSLIGKYFSLGKLYNIKNVKYHNILW